MLKLCPIANIIMDFRLTHSAPMPTTVVLLFIHSVADPSCTRNVFTSFNGRSLLMSQFYLDVKHAPIG